jgi:hypothetical protein
MHLAGGQKETASTCRSSSSKRFEKIQQGRFGSNPLRRFDLFRLDGQPGLDHGLNGRKDE